MTLNSLGVGGIQLGASIDTVTPMAPFNSDDRKLYLPDPGPEVWFRYLGDITEIKGAEGGIFSARSVYFSMGNDRMINRIVIHPDTTHDKPIEDILKATYGPGWVSSGGMGNLGGVNTYTMYLYNSRDKRSQICYTKTTSSDFGIDEIIFNLVADAQNVLNYKLVFRSWAQTE
ncbi:hypothetical protein PMI13_01150 [Chryseobacterium populi]|uniref:Uncharacterized protein n=2 Tax=Chryseobacterium populi TaxID=1144316 RepID=J3CMC2_9FLAO|nr:hypothetical protein PMI13_01150 [Chryseobacterium populi]